MSVPRGGATVERALPLRACVRLVPGLAETDAPTALLGEWTRESADAARRAHAERAHLAFTLVFAAMAETAALPPDLAPTAAPPAHAAASAWHFVAADRLELATWFLGLQSLSAVPLAHRISRGALLWTQARSLYRARRERVESASA